jgi:hypothetical protein
MSAKTIVSAVLAAAMFCALPICAVAEDAPKAEAKKPAKAKPGAETLSPNEIKATVPANYIQIPQMRLAVSSDINRRYRMLELEAWVASADPIANATMQSNKKKIAAAMKEDFLAYNWEAFNQNDTGIEIAKNVVRASVQRALGVKPDEVIMRVLILR